MNESAGIETGDYGSEFDSSSDAETKKRRKQREEDLPRKRSKRVEKEHKRKLGEEYEKEERIRHRIHFLALNGYDRHKQLVNNYMLYYGGRQSDFGRDSSNDKRDIDVIRENHQFLWDEDEDDEDTLSWDRNLAKRYWNKLYKEYCICDLSRYKENKVAMRWRIEKEVVEGKGQFFCANRKCVEREGLKTWEVNFGYLEHGEKKNALVKVRLCPDCSYKLNYHSKKREIKKEKKLRKKMKKRRKNLDDNGDDDVDDGDSCTSAEEGERKDGSIRSGDESVSSSSSSKDLTEHWKGPAANVDEDKSKEEEFDEYLEDLFM